MVQCRATNQVRIGATTVQPNHVRRELAGSPPKHHGHFIPRLVFRRPSLLCFQAVECRCRHSYWRCCAQSGHHSCASSKRQSRSLDWPCRLEIHRRHLRSNGRFKHLVHDACFAQLREGVSIRHRHGFGIGTGRSQPLPPRVG